MKRLTADELENINLRLNGSTTGPWGPSHTTAKECGNRYTGNLLLGHIAALEAELAEAREIDSVQAAMLGPLRTELDRVRAERDECRAEAKRYKAALEWIANIDNWPPTQPEKAIHAARQALEGGAK